MFQSDMKRVNFWYLQDTCITGLRELRLFYQAKELRFCPGVQVVDGRPIFKMNNTSWATYRNNAAIEWISLHAGSGADLELFVLMESLNSAWTIESHI